MIDDATLAQLEAAARALDEDEAQWRQAYMTRFPLSGSKEAKREYFHRQEKARARRDEAEARFDDLRQGLTFADLTASLRECRELLAEERAAGVREGLMEAVNSIKHTAIQTELLINPESPRRVVDEAIVYALDQTWRTLENLATVSHDDPQQAEREV